MKNNKKGFTLIELLAVIVILAILVMLAIPAVTRYLTSARINTFSDNALRAVEAVRNDVVTAGFSAGTQGLSGAEGKRSCDGTKCYYNQEAINALLENKMQQSSFGNSYTCLGIEVDRENNTYKMSMVDEGKNGFIGTNSGDIQAKETVILIGNQTGTCPTFGSGDNTYSFAAS